MLRCVTGNRLIGDFDIPRSIYFVSCVSFVVKELLPVLGAIVGQVQRTLVAAAVHQPADGEQPEHEQEYTQ
jgi:hypothetical protein